MKNINILISSSLLLSTSISAMDLHEDKKGLKSVRDVITTSHLEEKEGSIVDTFRNMFEYGKITGQVRVVHATNMSENAQDTYATAAGGKLKYELAKLNGFNAAMTLRYSEDITSASGETSQDKRDTGLSSNSSAYSTLSEAYLAYSDDNLDVKLGRQILDTPLADKDDIAMVQNSFEAATFGYSYENLSLNAGYISRWQGVDAGLDDGWLSTGNTTYISAMYSDFYDAQVWYYNISDIDVANNSIYADVTCRHPLYDHTSIYGALQYLEQSELSNSGVESSIYGIMAEIITHNFGINIAYNRSFSNNAKGIFSGFGGGALFTNMDSMILDEITHDRDAGAIVTGLSYEVNNFAFLYAYGNFKGKSNSTDQKEHIVEQDMGVEYNFNDEFVAYVIYVKSQDKQSKIPTDYDFDHVRVMANYNF
jgi:hypothetical protein